jgi:hypothetical protein
MNISSYLGIGQVKEVRVTIEDLEKFRDEELKIGDIYCCDHYTVSDYSHSPNKVRGDVIISRKYPHFAMTNKGPIQYIDIFKGSKVDPSKKKSK